MTNKSVKFIGKNGISLYQHLCYEAPFSVSSGCISTKIHYEHGRWIPSSWILGAAICAYRDFVKLGKKFFRTDEEGFEVSHNIFASLFETYLNQTRFYKRDKDWQIYVSCQYGVVTTTRPNLDQNSAPRIDINHLFWVARCASEVLEFVESEK